MILETDVREVLTTGVESAGRMNISAAVESHIIKLVTEHSYRAPLPSLIRELTSNAIDSHTEAKQEDPVIVSLAKNVANRWELSIEDFGLGLDADGFQKYIMGIGESTKRLSANLLGGYGAGAKSFLAYTNSATYVCRKDGKELKYLIFKGQEYPESMLIHEKDTTEPNGVRVIIELKTAWNEESNCINAIKQQLAYLPNVYFNVPGIDNGYKIHQSEDFQWNTLQPVSEIHISLKNIYYPIDWKTLGISAIHLPVALRFDDYEDLQPIFNREEIKWTEKSKQAIKDKINKVIDWFIVTYNESVKSIDVTSIPYNMDNLSGHNRKMVTLEGTTFDVTYLDQRSSIKFISPKVSGFEVLTAHMIYDNRFNFIDQFEVAAKIGAGKMYTGNRLDGNAYNAFKSDYYEIIQIEGECPKGNQRIFLYETIDNAYLIRKKWGSKKPTLAVYAERLKFNSNRIPKNQWRKAIQEYQSIEAQYLSQIKPITDYPVTKEWLEERKANRATGTYKYKKIAKEEVNLRQIISGVTKDYIIGPGSVIDVSNLDTVSITCYGLKDDKDKLVQLKPFGIKCYITSERDAEKIVDAGLTNWLTFDEFMKGDEDLFKEAAINQQKHDLYFWMNNDTRVKFIRTLESEWEDFYQEMRTAVASVKGLGFLKEEVLKVAEKKGYFDDLLAKRKRLNETIEAVDLEFLNYIHTYAKEGKDLAKEVYFLRKHTNNKRLHPYYE